MPATRICSATNANILTGGGMRQQTNADTGPVETDAYGYPVFNVPWTMNLSYSFNYSQTGLTSEFFTVCYFPGKCFTNKENGNNLLKRI